MQQKKSSFQPIGYMICRGKEPSILCADTRKVPTGNVYLVRKEYYNVNTFFFKKFISSHTTNQVHYFGQSSNLNSY